MEAILIFYVRKKSVIRSVTKFQFIFESILKGAEEELATRQITVENID